MLTDSDKSENIVETRELCKSRTQRKIGRSDATTLNKSRLSGACVLDKKK
jgi:hypothetical protein